MAKNGYKIPERFRRFVEPILLQNERIIRSFKESFRVDAPWDALFPKWLVLTNLRVLVLSREIPGIRSDEYYLSGMTMELFQDNVGLYNSVVFLSNGQQVYQMAVAHKRWAEALEFVHEVTKSIGQLDFVPESSVNNDAKTHTANTRENEGCVVNKRHLKDLERMGVITEEEYRDDSNKPC